MMNENDLVYRLHKRAEIRRQITTRKSVQNGEPDRIADLLEEAADEIATARILAQSIANEPIELSNDKIKWQVENHIRWCKDYLKNRE
jgi:hypothetical protein